MLCALVQNNIVVDIQTIPDDGGASYALIASEYQAAIDITSMVPQPQIGWQFTGNSLVTNGVVQMVITRLAFRERFTTSELISIVAGIAAGGTTGYILEVLRENIQTATFIDLSRSDTQAGVQELVALGLLTQARATAILTTPPTATEIYKG